MGMAVCLFCLVYASLIATVCTLVMLVFRKLITLHAGPRVTVGLWCFVLLCTTLTLLWLNRQNAALNAFLAEHVRVSFLPRIHLTLENKCFAVYPQQDGLLTRLEITGAHGRRVFDRTADVTAAVTLSFFAWLIGVAVSWLRVLTEHLQTKRLLRRIPAAEDPELVQALNSGRRRLGIRREIRALLLPGDEWHRNEFSPCVTGLRYPTLLLPEDYWDRLAPAARAAVIAHELMHVKKHDNARNLVLLFFRGIFWFAPAVRLALRVMRRDLELLRDRQTLGITVTGGERRIYAESIVSAAESCAWEDRRLLRLDIRRGSSVGFRIRLIGGVKKTALRPAAWLAVMTAALSAPAAVILLFRFAPLFQAFC